jgi:hypothetical protein
MEKHSKSCRARLNDRETAVPCRNAFRAIALAIWLAAAAAPAMAADMKYPDWESQWRNPAAEKSDAWDPTKPKGLGQQAPLTPDYQAILEASLAAQAAGGHGNDYSTSCVLPGMPRLMSLTAPMEMLISPDVTLMIFEKNVQIRRIYTDGRDWPDDAASFQGNSLGKWIDTDQDGVYDTLEIETRNFTGPRALESTGLPLHKDDETVVKERLSLDKGNKDILHNEITIDDHAFTHPWTVTKTYVRERNPKWEEYNCEVTNTLIVIGGEEYAVDAAGKLMPMRQGQPAPSLRHFK